MQVSRFVLFIHFFSCPCSLFLVSTSCKANSILFCGKRSILEMDCSLWQQENPSFSSSSLNAAEVRENTDVIFQLVEIIPSWLLIFSWKILKPFHLFMIFYLFKNYKKRVFEYVSLDEDLNSFSWCSCSFSPSHTKSNMCDDSDIWIGDFFKSGNKKYVLSIRFQQNIRL